MQIDLIDGSAHARGAAHQEAVASPSPRGAAGSTLSCRSSRPATSSSRRSTATTRRSCTGAPTPRDDVDLFFFGSDDAAQPASLKRPDPALTAAFDSHTYLSPRPARWHAPLRGARRSRSRRRSATTCRSSSTRTFGNTDRRHRRASRSSTACARWRACRSAPLLRLDAASTSKAAATISSRQRARRAACRAKATPAASAAASPAARHHDDRRSTQTNHVAPFVALDLLARSRSADRSRRSSASSIYDVPRLPGSPDAFDDVYVLPEPRAGVRYQINRGWRSRRRSASITSRPIRRRSCASFGNPTCCRSGVALRRSASTSSRPPTLHIEVAGLLQGHAQPGRARRARRRSDARERRASGASTAASSWCARSCARTSSAGSPTPSRAPSAGSPERAVAPLPVRPDPHPDPARQLQAAARLSGRAALPLRHRQPVHAGDRLVLRLNGDGTCRSHGAVYSARARPFNQLDVRFDKTWTFDRWRSRSTSTSRTSTRVPTRRLRYNFDFTQCSAAGRLAASCRSSAFEETSDAARSARSSLRVAGARRLQRRLRSGVVHRRLRLLASRPSRRERAAARRRTLTATAPTSAAPTPTLDVGRVPAPPPPATGRQSTTDCIALRPGRALLQLGDRRRGDRSTMPELIAARCSGCPTRPTASTCRCGCGSTPTASRSIAFYALRICIERAAPNRRKRIRCSTGIFQRAGGRRRRRRATCARRRRAAEVHERSELALHAP